MSLFNSMTIKVKRKTAGNFVKGVFVEGTESTFFIQGTWQPLTGEELNTLPEGRRGNGGYALFTETELQNRQDGISPDIVEVNGRDFEVINVELWQNSIIPHYRVICASKEARN